MVVAVGVGVAAAVDEMVGEGVCVVISPQANSKRIASMQGASQPLRNLVLPCV